MRVYNSSWDIFRTKFGSQLYGTSTPESDVDIRGICIPPREVLLDPFHNFEEQILTREEDTVIYSVKKFFDLAKSCNPNIIELFFAPENCITFITDSGRELIKRYDLFVSKSARFTFTGYAVAQLKKIKLHREWLMNPPDKEPDRKDFGLEPMPKFSYERLVHILHAPEETIVPEFRQYASKEMGYRAKKEYWDNYQMWKKTRNPDRAVLEGNFGYDTKHAMHLWRLLGEGEELLSTGKLTMPRPDAKFLLEIRRGYFTYDDLIISIDTIFDKMDKIPSPLPEKANEQKLLEFYLELIGE